MANLKYTVCSYAAGGARDELIDFGVLAVSEDEVIIIGCNLTGRVAESHDPMTQYVIDNTAHVLYDRLHNATADNGRLSGFEILDLLLSKSPSSLTYRPIQETQSAASPLQLATQIFEEQISKHTPQKRSRNTGEKIGWQDDPCGETVIRNLHLVPDDQRALVCT